MCYVILFGVLPAFKWFAVVNGYNREIKIKIVTNIEDSKQESILTEPGNDFLTHLTSEL